MAGERLYADIKRMELGYLETDIREYEIAKSISLVLFDPWALITLKETGQCVINLPESLFDMDYPGHWLRRIKTVSLTIPCLAGPYTSVNCTLTLLNSKIRTDAIATSQQDYASDAHFMTSHATTQSIATSTAQNDSGLFEVNFRDERYLPFEGAGVISTWQIEMPRECNAIDPDSITDVVLNFRYTSRYGGDGLRQAARQAAVLPPRPAQGALAGPTPLIPQPNLQRLFSLKHEFPTEWYKFLHPTDTTAANTMQIALGPDRFPYQYRSYPMRTYPQVELVALLRQGTTWQGALELELGPPGRASHASVALSPDVSPFAGVPYGTIPSPPRPEPLPAAGPGSPPVWILQAQEALSSDVVNGISDILMLCHYSVK